MWPLYLLPILGCMAVGGMLPLPPQQQPPAVFPEKCPREMGGTVLRGAQALRGQVKMPSSLETAGKGDMSLEWSDPLF